MCQDDFSRTSFERSEQRMYNRYPVRDQYIRACNRNFRIRLNDMILFYFVQVIDLLVYYNITQRIELHHQEKLWRRN